MTWVTFSPFASKPPGKFHVPFSFSIAVKLSTVFFVHEMLTPIPVCQAMLA
ncbi:MAG: hypothetical protein ACXQTT_05845 [Candidatus Syntropharchaeia archaeon]